MGRWHHNGIGRRILSGLAVGALAASLGGTPAAAQPGRGGFDWESAYATSLDRAELERLAEDLALTEDQTLLAEALLDGFRQAYAERSEAARAHVRELFETARENRDWESIGQLMIQERNTWRQERQSLEDAFISNLKSILTEDQLKRWPMYEIGQRRRATLAQHARLDGEDIDVVALVERLELTDEQRRSIAPTLQAYALELDGALQARNAVVDPPGGINFNFNDPEAFETMRRNVEQAARLRVNVRDINFRYAEILAAQLPPDLGARLLAEFNEEAFPRIYRDTPADEYLARLSESDRLTPQQRSVIQSIRQDFESRVRDLNRRLADLERRDDAQPPNFDWISRMGAWRNASEQERERMREQMREEFTRIREEDPRRPLFEQKRELAASTLDAVFNVLTPDQQAEFPKPSAERQRFQNWQDRDGDRNRDRDRRRRDDD